MTMTKMTTTRKMTTTALKTTTGTMTLTTTMAITTSTTEMTKTMTAMTPPNHFRAPPRVCPLPPLHSSYPSSPSPSSRTPTIVFALPHFYFVSQFPQAGPRTRRHVTRKFVSPSPFPSGTPIIVFALPHFYFVSQSHLVEPRTHRRVTQIIRNNRKP